MVILCWNKNANVSQCVVAKIWLKHNYKSKSYWRRGEKWKKVRNERNRERGGRKEDQELRRFVALCEKQSNKVAGKALCKCAAGNLNVCDAPLCGSMSKHFTRSFVAQRIKSAFHVFASAKTFHFSAERKAAQMLSLYLPKNFTSVARAHNFA